MFCNVQNKINVWVFLKLTKINLFMTYAQKRLSHYQRAQFKINQLGFRFFIIICTKLYTYNIWFLMLVGYCLLSVLLRIEKINKDKLKQLILYNMKDEERESREVI